MDLSTRDGRRILGERIKRASKDAGISLDELAVRIGCSRALIYQYVSGASLAQPDRLQQISTVVGKSLSWFFDDGATSARTQPDATTTNDERAAIDARSVRERIALLRALVTAYSSPPDWRQVADTCQQLVGLLPENGSPTEIAETLFTHGNALLRLQEFGAAKTKLEDAASRFRELGLMERSLDCLQSIGNADIHLGRTVQALAVFRRVAEGQEWSHRWQGSLSIGAVHEMVGDYSAAADAFVHAQEIIGENTDTKSTEVAYLYVDGNWANLELAWADYPRARDTSERCIVSAQRLGDQDQYIEALLNASASHMGLGNSRHAAVLAEQAMNVAELVRDYERWSIALASRSMAMSACRMISKAIVDAKGALSIALRHGSHRAEVLSQKATAIAYLTAHNVVEARYHIDQGLASAEASRLRLPIVEFQVLAAICARLEGNAPQASELANTARESAGALDAKHVQHDAELVLAHEAFDAGDWAGAIAHAEQAVEFTGKMGAGWLAWKSQSILAEAYVRSGKTQEANAAFTNAVASLAQNRANCTEAAGSDTLPESPAVKELWVNWILFLENTGKSKEAAKFIESADWEPLAGLVEEKRNAS